MNILKLPSFYLGNLKIFRYALGQFIPNRPSKLVITSTVLILYSICKLITRITWLPKLTPKVLDPRSSIFSSLFSRNIVKHRSSLKEVFCKKSALKVLLKISQNSKENTCPRVSFLIILFAYFFLIIFYFKKSLWHSCFPVMEGLCSSSATFIFFRYFFTLQAVRNYTE